MTDDGRPILLGMAARMDARAAETTGSDRDYYAAEAARLRGLAG